MATEWTIPSAPFPDKARLIVGVSGGSDSLGLLRFLLEQLPRASRRLVVAHVNYGLRGSSSRKDEETVRHFCLTWKLPFRRLRVQNFKLKVKRERRSLQDYARDIRYSFFHELVKKEKAWGVVIAHHREDQAETVLDRLLRGAGPRGLSGLRPVQIMALGHRSSPLRIWRPLLSYSREQIRAFLKSRRIQWREDSTNQGTQYRRNQIRHQILPFLRRWNPRLTEVLARIGEITSSEDLLMESLLDPLDRRLKSRWKRGSYECPVAGFEKIPLALQRRWVRRVAERLSDDARGLSFERIEEIIRLWDGREVGPRDLGFGLVAGRTVNRAFLRRKA